MGTEQPPECFGRVKVGSFGERGRGKGDLGFGWSIEILQKTKQTKQNKGEMQING